MADTETKELPETDEGEEKREPLKLEIKIDSPSTCERHVTVKIPHEEVERYFDKAFSNLVPTAQVPGFRAGRAPRKLIEQRFRKEVKDQVKADLLMDAMAQVTEDQKLAAISEPEFDVAAVEVPDEGPLAFEFDIEVRPEFEMPNWKGLTIERPTREFTDKDIDERIQQILSRHGRLVPIEGAASAGDYVVVNLTFKDGETTLSTVEEEVLRIRPTLSFRDGKVEKFDKLMVGVKAGETRKAEAKIAEDAPNESLRGKQVTAEFEVLEVKKMELPELTASLLEEIGGFESEEALRAAVRSDLERQLEYHQQQQARQQITQLLVASADWDLPPALLKRQSHRELERAVLELRRSGFPESEIVAHGNELRQNSLRNTARALKEHFILERIAEDEKIEDSPEDYEAEMRLIAQQSGQSVRRVRAQMEKRGLMDILRNQIVERKTIALVLSHAKFKDKPFELASSDTEAIDESASGEEGDEAIPEAKQGGEAEPRRERTDHT